MKESSIDKIAKRFGLSRSETEELLDDVKKEVGDGLGMRALMAGGAGVILGAVAGANPASGWVADENGLRGVPAVDTENAYISLNNSPLYRNYDDVIKAHPAWELLDDFEDAGIWSFSGGGSGSFDSSDYVTGSQSMKLSIPGGDNVNAIGDADKFAFDPRRFVLRMWIKTDNAAGIDTRRFYTTAPDTSNIYKFPLRPVDNLEDNIWTQIVVPWRQETEGTPDPVTCDNVVFAFTTKAGETVNLWIDKLEFLPPLVPNGLVTLFFDDGSDDHYSVAYPTLAKYGFGGVSAVYDDSAITVSQMQEMQTAGWDIVNHGYESLSADSATESEFEEDTKKMRKKLIENNLNGYNLHVLPGGHVGHRSTLRKYCYLSRTITTGVSIGAGWIPQSIVPAEFILEANDTNGLTEADAETIVDEAIDRCAWCAFVFHVIGGTDEFTASELDSFCSYLDTNNVPVITMSEAWRIMNLRSKEEICEALGGRRLVTTTSNYQIQWFDQIVVSDGSNNAVTIQLPNPASNKGKQFTVFVKDVTNDTTIKRYASENINGSASDLTLSLTNSYRTLESDGTDWWITESVTENSGKTTFSGDGTTVSFSWAHGLADTPTSVSVTPGSADANGDFYVTADATDITVTFATAPADGTDNVVLWWEAEV